jgi:hypothetical protein
MKLFQIEEPDGAPGEVEGPGAAIGIDIEPAFGGAVAISVGGNAEILPGGDGERRLAAPGLLGASRRFDEAELTELLLALRGRAEKQLVRPVTHAVIAAGPIDDAARRAIETAAATAGIVVLSILTRAEAAARAAGAPPAEAAVLGAAIEAEDLAPPLLP